MAAVSFSGLPPLSSIFRMYASISAFIMMLQTILNQLIPYHLQNYLLDLIRRYFFSPSPTNATIVIEKRYSMQTNEVYSAAKSYLSSLGADLQRLKISKSLKDPNLTVRFAGCVKIADSHDGIDLEWRFVDEEEQRTRGRGRGSDNNHPDWSENKKKHFELTFEKKFRDEVLDSYIPLVLQKPKMIQAEKKVLKLHTVSTNSCGYDSYGYSDDDGDDDWDSINLEHPFTFQTLAMEPKLKEEIMKDLDRFIQRKDFYRRVGRAWKRGYLLHGPPGTGKSSLIAAMANYLKFDIYDLELATVTRDSDLRELMLRTPNRSILVIEDIDCTVELPGRKARSRPRDNQFTLSGLLNFIDGLWSSCSDERIIVFTTNHKEKLDPALLRPGRMDMHIHMSYLTPNAFKLLASTYLDIHGDDPRLSEIGNLIEGKNVTPAEVSEELMRSEDIDTCLDRLVDFLENKNSNDDNNVIPPEVAEDLMRSKDIDPCLNGVVGFLENKNSNNDNDEDDDGDNYDDDDDDHSD